MPKIVRGDKLRASGPSPAEAIEVIERTRTLLLALDNLATHLHTLPDVDSLYQKATLMGRSLLDIDRMGILLIDAKKEWMTGTFGTDEKGNPTDERNFRIPFPERNKLLHSSLENRNFVMIRTDETIYHMETPVGKGWNAIYALWDGETPFGFISCDNLLTARPLGFFQAELFGMFASNIGSLILRKRYELGLREQLAFQTQFVAHTAHEINTPLGALVSSNSSVSELVRRITVATPGFYASLPAESRQFFDRTLEALVGRPAEPVGPKGSRKALLEALETLGFPEPAATAEFLEVLAFPRDEASLRALALVPRYQELLEHLCLVADTLTSTRIIGQSAEKVSRFVKDLLAGHSPR